MSQPDSAWYQPPPAPWRGGVSGGVFAVALLIVFVVGLALGGALLPGSTPIQPTPPATLAATLQGSLPPGVTPSPSPSQPANAPGDFDVFWQALQTIREHFVGRADLTDQQLTYGAIRGLVEALGDTGHSTFLTPEQLAQEGEALSGKVVGIGVLLGQRGGQVVIVSVISGGPASRAGLHSGDLIVAVDGTDVSRLGPDEVAPKVRGKAGTSVTLTIERPSSGERLDFTMTREEINVPASSWTMIAGTRIALVRLIQFSQGAAADLSAKLDQARAAGAQSIILDLRSNPGGYVDEAVDAASLFLHDKTVYITENADGSRQPVPTNNQIAATDLPLVVLIDEGTASSAEILSGALLSAQRAQLVGQTTFGTGTVLTDFTLSDGSAVRLAIQRWLTPDGELIFGKGITPTIEVALSASQQALEPDQVAGLTVAAITPLDPQLSKAIELLNTPGP